MVYDRTVWEIRYCQMSQSSEIINALFGFLMFASRLLDPFVVALFFTRKIKIKRPLQAKFQSTLTIRYIIYDSLRRESTVLWLFNAVNSDSGSLQKTQIAGESRKQMDASSFALTCYRYLSTFVFMLFYFQFIIEAASARPLGLRQPTRCKQLFR